MVKTIIIAGSVAQKPHQAGHTWQFLQYLLGLRRLGWEVIFCDRLEPGMCVDAAGRPCSLAESVNLAYFQEVMAAFGLSETYSLDYDNGAEVVGLPRREVVERTGRAACLINVMGFLQDPAILEAARLRVFLDTDPGFPQMWCDLGLHDPFRGHDRFVTIAENMGRADCTIPACGRQWITWRQPVVLEQWPFVAGPGGEFFTSVGSWRGPYGVVEFKGVTYGLRVHEFRKFLALPKRTGRPFEVALDIHSAETKDLEALTANAWSLADPQVVARDPWVYRQYLQNSRAEFMATKGMYVQSHSGWFSERSINYLASGRPVLAQDTGLAGLYPLGEGLLTFTTLEEAAAGVEEITAHYEKHSRAARALAVEFFDSNKVMSDLLAKVGAG